MLAFCLLVAHSYDNVYKYANPGVGLSGKSVYHNQNGALLICADSPIPTNTLIGSTAYSSKDPTT